MKWKGISYQAFFCIFIVSYNGKMTLNKIARLLSIFLFISLIFMCTDIYNKKVLSW